MLSGLLITLFTTRIKLSWERQPLYDISLFHVGAEVTVVFLTSGDFTIKIHSRCCVCMGVQKKPRRFKRALLCKTNTVQVIHYPQCANKMRLFGCNTLANRGKKSHCLVKDLVAFCNMPPSRSAHVALCLSLQLENDQGNPCCGLLRRFCLLPSSVCCGAGLGTTRTLFPLSTRGEMGHNKDFTECCQVLGGLDLSFPRVRVTAGREEGYRIINI